MRTRILAYEPPFKKLGVAVCACNPRTGEVTRKIPGALWLPSLAYLVSSGQ